MTTIKLSGGSFGNEQMLVQCDLSQASAPVLVNYCTDHDSEFQSTQYQCADARHTNAGLIEIGKKLAATALEVPSDEFECDDEEIDTTPKFNVSDTNSTDFGLTYDAAVERIAEWYEDADQWSDGEGDDEIHDTIADGIASIDRPSENGDIDDLKTYALDICDAVAEAMKAKAHAGHGNYYVSAADSIGLSLTVEESED